MRSEGTTRCAKVSYIHTDHVGAPQSASGADGQMVWEWNRDAFGAGKVNRDVDGDGQNTIVRLRFPGQYYDRESGLFYNHFRDYDPKLGRYIQSDPIGLFGGINRYAYVGGNPVNLIDPKGLSECVFEQTLEFFDGSTGEFTGTGVSNRAVICPDHFGGAGSQTSLGAGGSSFSGFGGSFGSLGNFGFGLGGNYTQYADADADGETPDEEEAEECTAETNLLAQEMRAALADPRTETVELGGLIYRLPNGSLGASPAVVGKNFGVNIFSAPVPENATIIGGWHTHPNGRFNIDPVTGAFTQASQFFSPQDFVIANPNFNGSIGRTPVISGSPMTFLGLGLGLNSSRRSGLFFLPHDAVNNININTDAGVLEQLMRDNAVNISSCGG